MPRTVHPLTDTQIRKAKPKAVRYRLHDGRGLLLEVSPVGSKRWLYRYAYEGRQNIIALRNAAGSNEYPHVSLAEARRLAEAARGLLAQGRDPAQDEQKNPKSDIATFRTVAESWHQEKSPGWSVDTVRKARYILDTYLYPHIGDVEIAELNTAQVKPPLVSLHAKAPELAVKARQYCNQIVEYAIQEGLREDGKLLILKNIFPRNGKKGHYPAITRENLLPQLIAAINQVPTLRVRTALWMTLYTVMRPGVVVRAEWSELDLEKREWHVHAGKMKMGYAHVSPLPTQLVERLITLRALTGESRYVFPGKQHARHLSRDSLSLALRKQGLRDVLVPHGLRATFRTLARERLGIQPEVLEAQLAHAKKDEIQAAYDRTQLLQERHAAVQAWADYLSRFSAAAS